MTRPADDLVEPPVLQPAPAHGDPTTAPRKRAAKRATLLDRLVSTAHVDRVVIDVAELERDLDALRGS